MAAYKFNSSKGKPGKSAGGGRFVGQQKKAVSHSNESGTPGQDGKGRMTFGASAATKTFTYKP